MTSSSDCLVLLIEGYDPELNISVNKTYVLYDNVNQQYLVRGLDFDKETQKKSFSFTVDYDATESIVDFTDFFSSGDQVKIAVYNFDDLPLTSEEITYEYLEDYSSEEYEIFTFRPTNYSKTTIRRMLTMVKNMYNHY